jgi:Cu-Zn family superoxide dismutase
MRRTALAILCTAAVAALAACAPAQVERDTPPAGAPAAARATANLAPASASLVSGTLTLTTMGDGVHVGGEIGGLPAGAHGFHVHERGDCSAADASSAGGHFNPTNMPHGRSGPKPHHLGDSDNIFANANRVATVDAHLHDVTLGTGLPNDIAGRAIIVHADADDYTSQPSGDAGARVACGVITVIR